MCKGKGQSKRFIQYIAYLQVIGCILVVLGHSFHEYPHGIMSKNMIVYQMLYTFRMPLFMFVSGFLMVYTSFGNGRSPRNPLNFTAGKLKRLLLPFFCLTLLTFYPRAHLSFMADDTITPDVPSFIKAFLYTDSMPMPFLWFLQASFILLVFTYAFIFVSRKLDIPEWLYCILILCLFIIIPFIEIPAADFLSISQIQRLGIYFATGICYAHFHNAADRFINRSPGLLFILSGVAWACIYLFMEKTFLSRTVCSLSGILMCISAAHWLVKHHVTILDHLIGATYLIFLLSWFFTVLAQQVLHHYTDFPWWVYTIISLITGIYLPLLIYHWMCKHPDVKIVKIGALLLGQNIRAKNKDK